MVHRTRLNASDCPDSRERPCRVNLRIVSFVDIEVARVAAVNATAGGIAYIRRHGRS